MFVLAALFGSMASAEDVKIEKGARLFAEVCASSLPSMSDTEQKALTVVTREYGGNGFALAGKEVMTGAVREAIITYRTSKILKDGKNQCSVHAFRVDPNEAYKAWVGAFKAAKPKSVSMRKTEREGTVAAWKISGSKSNMVLEARQVKRKGFALILTWQ